MVLGKLPIHMERKAGEGGRKRKREKKKNHWWLTPVVLATWEAEIRRIMV
jgi:hypothetical protein